jgi:hypothetical protein
MSDTYLLVTTARCGLLLKMLEDVPPKNRDATYQDMLRDVNKINGIWKNIASKNKIKPKAKK